jgi:hypothetical protein
MNEIIEKLRVIQAELRSIKVVNLPKGDKYEGFCLITKEDVKLIKDIANK